MLEVQFMGKFLLAAVVSVILTPILTQIFLLYLRSCETLTLTTQSHGCCLSVEFLQSASLDTLQKHAADLAMKYPGDFYVLEIVSKVESFKFQTAELLKDPTTATPMELLQLIHVCSLQEIIQT